LDNSAWIFDGHWHEPRTHKDSDVPKNDLGKSEGTDSL
jgi:hypothetical protein